MLVQTASVEFTGTPEGGYYLLITTPQGTAKCPVDRAFITPHTPPFLGVLTPTPGPRPKKIPAKKNKRASIKQETEIMEALGGRRQAGSGALAHLKGDGRVRDKFRVEAKYTRSGSYRVTRQELNKIRGECTPPEVPLFIIDFVDPETGGSPDRWVMVEFDRFRRMEYQPSHAAHQPSGPR